MLMRYFAVFGGGGRGYSSLESSVCFAITTQFGLVASSAQEPHRARDSGIKQCKSVLCINVLNLGSPEEPV